MPIPPSLARTRAAAVVQPLLAILRQRQQAYCEEHGRCFQLLPTHDTLPEDGDERQVTRAGARPDYQRESTADLLPELPRRLPCVLDVAQYTTPAGDVGWVARATLRVQGAVWVRTWHDGPESEEWRESGWERVPSI